MLESVISLQLSVREIQHTTYLLLSAAILIGFKFTKSILTAQIAHYSNPRAAGELFSTALFTFLQYPYPTWKDVKHTIHRQAGAEFSLLFKQRQ